MKLKGRNKVSPEFSMSSMTDIVFLLLIFFMITVSIDKDLNYFLDKKPISVDNLDTELKSALKGVENPTIILRVEESVPIENAVTVMDVANQNQFKVILAVRPK